MTRAAAALATGPFRAVPALAVLALVAGLLWATSALATFPGANGEIGFLCRAAAVPRVCGIDPAGGFPWRAGVAAGGSASGSAPRWSPDGRRIAYEPADPRRGIQLIDVADATVRGVPGTRDAGQPAWSPAGDRIALVRPPGRPNPGIFTVDLDGRDWRPVVADGAHPDWSPDGSTLAYDGRGEVLLHDLASGRSRPLTRTPPGSSSGLPSWSPDGRRIAFARRTGRGKTKTENVFTIAVDGSDERQLTHNRALAGDTDPSWSPDGRLIAFVHVPKKDGRSFVAVIGADGSGRRTLAGPPGPSALTPDWGPRAPGTSWAREPRLTGPRLRPAAVRPAPAARRSPSARRRRPDRTGATLSFRSSGPGVLLAAVQRARGGGWRTVARPAGLDRTVDVGPNRKRLRTGGRPLPRGTYRLALRVRSPLGVLGPPAYARFRILARS